MARLGLKIQLWHNDNGKRPNTERDQSADIRSNFDAGPGQRTTPGQASMTAPATS
jgi:hypothetical protein